MKNSMNDIPFQLIDGQPACLADYAGSVVLLVNVASKCGLTPQYKALEALYLEKKNEGLVILGFPANDFGAQEPGTHQEIADFCEKNFGVTFPLAEKISVTGPLQHPLYVALTAAQPTATEIEPGAFRSKLARYGHHTVNAADILWNFEKFVISRSGEVVGRFAPDVAPESPVVRDLLAAQLKVQ
ncbi:MAG: glutathione peroxidase [Burkholderiaceae bacterium]|jgi:glutathione peroxidase